MKLYMIFSRSEGPQYGAGLVFAHGSREAKKIGWDYFHDEIIPEYTDTGVRLLRDCDWLIMEADPAKWVNDESHGIYPKSCEQCECWGQSQIGEDGLCEECHHEMVKEETAGDIYVEESEYP